MSYTHMYFESDVSSVEWSSKDLINLRNWYNDENNNPSPFDNDGTFTYTRFSSDVTAANWFTDDYTNLESWFNDPPANNSPFTNFSEPEPEPEPEPVGLQVPTENVGITISDGTLKLYVKDAVDSLIQGKSLNYLNGLNINLSEDISTLTIALTDKFSSKQELYNMNMGGAGLILAQGKSTGGATVEIEKNKWFDVATGFTGKDSSIIVKKDSTITLSDSESTTVPGVNFGSGSGLLGDFSIV